jgi:hypothetical protein
MNLIAGLVFIGVLAILLGFFMWSKKHDFNFYLNRPATKTMKKLITSMIAATKVLKRNLFPVGFIIFITLMVFAWYWPDKLFPSTIPINIETQKAFIQLLGGIAIFITAYVGWRRVTVLDRQVLAMEDGQITERYTKAIEQLGSENITIRIGGVFALERIAKDSIKRGDHRDYHTVMEVLTCFIREKSPLEKMITVKTSDGHEAQACQLPEVISQDIQAALTVIGRRALKYGEGEDQRLDFSKCNLKAADLKVANLQGARLVGVCLQGGNLPGANLKWANLEGADLQEAEFTMACLQGTYLFRANLRGACLHGAILHGAILVKANLEGADLRTDLEGASL